MTNKTLIDWVKNPDGSQGYTWNPITGCLNGCDYCYARKLANTRLKSRYLANNNGVPQNDILDYGRDMKDPFYPRFWEERLGQIPLFGKSLGVFVCDMSDLFGIRVPKQWTDRVLNHIGECQRHRFYLLTKQPQNLIKFSPFPDNCWVGVSATNATTLYNACIHLSKIEATVKYVSMEPLLEWGPPDIANIIRWLQLGFFTGKRGIGWVIIGAQTKPTVMPKIEWVQEIVKACDKAGIPVFLKDNLLELVNYTSPETEFAFNKEGYYRQEMPK